MTNKYSIRKYFKSTYSTACIVFNIAGLSIGLVLIVWLYSNGIILLQWTIIFSILLTLFSILIIIWYIFRTLKLILMNEKETQINSCKNCVYDYSKYFFKRHNLISLHKIIEREKKLKEHDNTKGCEVLNFTTLADTYTSYQDTNIQISNIIEENRVSGVQYKVVCTDKSFITSRNQKIYGAENIKYYEIESIFKNTEFDYLIHKTPEDLYCYASVNFTSKTENCNNCPYRSKCDYLNDHLFYRVLSPVESKQIYNVIISIFNSEDKSDEKN